jgi:hypothetical protein
MAQKMLVGDKDTVLLIPAFEVNGVPQAANPGTGLAQPLDAITSALLNQFITTNTPDDANAHWGGNITCAVLDNMNLAMKDSSTKNVKTLCSVGNAEELTYYNFDAVMNFLRDVDPADATSEFNLPITLTQAPDVAYLIAHRIGYSRTAAAAAGQEWNFYYAWTDYPIPASSDGEYQEVGETFVSKGLVNFKSILGS